MRRLSKAPSVSFLFLFLASTAVSQQPSLNAEKEQRDKTQRLQAISTVEITADESPLWTDKKAAVQVLAGAADLLWDETPAQATKWIAKAWILIDQVAEPAKNEKLKEFFNPSVRAELQTVVIGIARKHDDQLAENFLKQLTATESGAKNERGAFDDRTARSEQLLRLAQQAVDANPELAFTFAERSLADGVSQGLQNVLTTLRKKNVALANRLFDLALARFSGGTSDPSEAEVLAGYLFQPGFTFSADSSGQAILVLSPNQRNLPGIAGVEPQRARSFLVAVYQSLLTRPILINTDEDRLRGQRVLVLGNRILGRYNAFAPEFSQPAHGFLAQLQRQIVPADQTALAAERTPLATNNESTTTKTLAREEIYEKRLAALEDQADKEDNANFKGLAYLQAALAAKPEDYQRAKCVAEKISDNDLRTDAVSFVLYRAALSFVERDEIEKAMDIAPQIGDVLRSAVVKIAIAQKLVTSNAEKRDNLGELNFKEQRAFDLLIQVDGDLRKVGPSVTGAKIALGRTAVLAKLDKAQALISLEQAVRMINKLEGFDLKDPAAPDLGLEASSSSGATVARPRIGFDLRSAVEPMIKTNFEQILSIVERFAVKEVNGMSRLEVAKLYLQNTKQPHSSPKELSNLHR